MSSSGKEVKRAFELFEAAFDRLRQGRPVNLPTGTPVSLSNVAREAGKSPSALRIERYPVLLERIKGYMASAREKKTSSESSLGKSRNRTLKQRLVDCQRQRDHLLSICHSQQTLIEELKDEVSRLSVDKEVKFRREL